MTKPTHLSWFGWTIFYLLIIKRDLFSKKPQTAPVRAERARNCLSYARRTFFKAARIATVNTAYDLVRGGGPENIEEIRAQPEHLPAFREMMQIQLEMLTDDRIRSDLMAVGLNIAERESFFRENLMQHLRSKDLGDKLTEAISGYHLSKKPISDFTPDSLDNALNLDASQLSEIYKIDPVEALS